MIKWVVPEIKHPVKSVKIAPGEQLASFLIKPSVASQANGNNDLITDLLVICDGSPALDIIFFSQSDMQHKNLLGSLHIWKESYRLVFNSPVAEYHDLHIPVKATGATGMIQCYIMVPQNFHNTMDYAKLSELILKFGVEQA